MIREPILKRQAAVRMLLSVGLAALGGACGRSDASEEASALPAQELYNRIETARETKPDEKKDVPRLGVLADGHVPAALRAAPCRLTRGGALLLVADRSTAAARIDGRVAELRAGGPLSASGAYLTGKGVTVSIGRTAVPPEAAAAGGAKVSIGGADDKPVEKLDASWSCPLPG